MLKAMSYMKVCDCPYVGRIHFQGERNCILCQCENCAANYYRSIFKLLPCIGPQYGSDGKPVEIEEPLIVSTSGGKSSDTFLSSQ